MIKASAVWIFTLSTLVFSVAGNTAIKPVIGGPFTEQSESDEFKIEGVAQGLGIVWGMAFISNSELLLTSKDGRIHLLDVQKSKIQAVSGGPDSWERGQGGLMDVAVVPNYQPGGWIYFTYAKKFLWEAATTLARAKLKNGQLTDLQDLLVTESKDSGGRHFGSRIAFDGQGHLFFTVGDRGERPWAQDLSNHAGTVLRLKIDGSVPGDNPFIGQENALPEIWSYGHRNPQGIAYDFNKKRLWTIEHGPRGGDEINLVRKGRNYGWPTISYGKEYALPMAVGEATSKAGMEQPVVAYIPSIAPSSLLLYSGAAFPQWQGNLFAGALKLQHINRIVLNDEGQAIEEIRLLGKFGERIRSLIQSPEGWIYFSTDSGGVFRIRPR